MNCDRVTGLMSLILGVLVAVLTLQLPKSMMPSDIGPRIFPAITAALFIICGAGLLLKKAPARAPEQAASREELRRLAVISAVVLAFVVLMDLVGFLLPTAAVLYILCSMFSREKNVAQWKRILFSVVVTAAIYILFVHVMSLRLPTGRLF